MLQLYRYFKNSFDHNKVIVGLFPTNDFSDNSIEYGQVYFKKRYKPYYIPTEIKDSFELTYSLQSLSNSKWSLENYQKYRFSFFYTLQILTVNAFLA